MVMVAIMIVVVVPMVVTPSPVFLLFFGRNLAEVAPGVSMSLIGPSPIENHFVIVPDVIVSVVGVVNAIVVVALGAGHARRGQRSSQEKGNYGMGT